MFNFITKIINFFRGRKMISEEDILLLSETKKLNSQKMLLFFVFDQFPSNPKDYLENVNNINFTPLYVATTQEEAISACIYLKYLKCTDHYFKWCAINNFKPGIYEVSWWEYLISTVGNINVIFESEFKIIPSEFSFGDIISAFRSLNSSAFLGLQTQNEEEIIRFTEGLKVSNIELGLPASTPLDRLLEMTGTKNVSEYLSKVLLLCPTDTTSASTPNSGLGQIWKHILNGPTPLVPDFTRSAFHSAVSLAATSLSSASLTETLSQETDQIVKL